MRERQAFLMMMFEGRIIRTAWLTHDDKLGRNEQLAKINRTCRWVFDLVELGQYEQEFRDTPVGAKR